MAAVVLAIVSSTAILPFLAGNQQVTEAAKLEHAAALGQALMEEILARPFSDPQGTGYTPGPETGETTRNLYDNIDDFHGYTETAGAIKNFKNAAASTISNADFSRQASVTYVTFPALNQQTADVNSILRIEVRVYFKTTLLLKLERLATRED